MDGRANPEAKDSLYERDFHEWAMAQAAALRAAAEGRTAGAVDWDNLIEEVESLGRSELSQLESRLTTIAVHLLKLACSGDTDPAPGWRVTVLRTREDTAALLRASPSLRRRVPELADDLAPRARRLAARELEAYADRAGAMRAERSAPLTADQLLSDWWPDQPPPG
jgi:hypothetical protein